MPLFLMYNIIKTIAAIEKNAISIKIIYNIGKT